LHKPPFGSFVYDVGEIKSEYSFEAIFPYRPDLIDLLNHEQHYVICLVSCNEGGETTIISLNINFSLLQLLTNYYSFGFRTKKKVSVQALLE
jgi:hypothetical protein